ncbi:MAG: hypothetical protein WC926_04565 [Candidatus Paceibacterota bacterium]|jgi:hypothetical protein
MEGKIYFFSTAAAVLAFFMIAGSASAQDGQDAGPCFRSAIEYRENSIQEAFSLFAAAMGSAFQDRERDLLAAWKISDKNERSKAVRSAWSKFKETDKNASQTFKRSKSAAWKRLISDMKGCGERSSGDNIWDELSL